MECKAIPLEPSNSPCDPRTFKLFLTVLNVSATVIVMQIIILVAGIIKWYKKRAHKDT